MDGGQDPYKVKGEEQCDICKRSIDEKQIAQPIHQRYKRYNCHPQEVQKASESTKYIFDASSKNFMGFPLTP